MQATGSALHISPDHKLTESSQGKVLNGMLQAPMDLSHLRYRHTSVKHAWNGGSSGTGQENIVTQPKFPKFAKFTQRESSWCGAAAADTDGMDEEAVKRTEETKPVPQELVLV